MGKILENTPKNTPTEISYGWNLSDSGIRCVVINDSEMGEHEAKRGQDGNVTPNNADWLVAAGGRAGAIAGLLCVQN